MTNQIKIHINLVSLNFFKELTFTDVFVSPLNMWRKHLFFILFFLYKSYVSISFDSYMVTYLHNDIITSVILF